VYSLGGHVDQQPGSNLVDEYVEGATGWVSAPPMLHGRMYATSCAFDNKIYMFGNITPYMYTPVLPTDMFVHSLGMIGGSPNLQVSAATPHAESYDPSTRRWTAIANMPRARANARAVVVEGRILLVVYLSLPNHTQPGK
jgi:hypothetical protein